MEFGVRSVSVGSVMVDGDEAAEVPYIITIACHVLLGVVRTVHDTGLRAPACLVLAAGNNVDDTTHGVRTV